MAVLAFEALSFGREFRDDAMVRQQAPHSRRPASLPDEAWPHALFAALELFAHDAELEAVLEPLRQAIDTTAPGWRCRVEIFQNPLDSSRAVRDATLRSIAAQGISGRQPEFISLNNVKRPTLVAPLFATDHHVVGALVLEAGTEDLEPPAFDDALIGLCRLMALFAEDRGALSTQADQDALLRAVADAVPDALIMVDSAGAILSFNAAAETLFGWASDDILGKPVSWIVPDPDGGEETHPLAHFCRRGLHSLLVDRTRFDAVTHEGRLFPVEISVSEVRRSGERRFVGAVRDLTERLEREERLSALGREAEDAARLSAIGEMAASIAHEVNQPLTAIGNYIDAALLKLRAEAGADGGTVELLERARQMVHDGGEVVRRVRRLTQRGVAQFEPLDVDEVVDDTLEHFEPAFRRTRIRLLRERGPAPCHANIDRIQIQQLVSNLLRNAIDAVDGRQPRDVLVSTRLCAEEINLVVEDTGPGVPAEKRGELFQSFTTWRADGLGLGLAISRRIAEAHNGSISYEDVPGGGARFVVRMPLQGGQDGCQSPERS